MRDYVLIIASNFLPMINIRDLETLNNPKKAQEGSNGAEILREREREQNPLQRSSFQISTIVAECGPEKLMIFSTAANSALRGSNFNGQTKRGLHKVQWLSVRPGVELLDPGQD